MAMKALVVGVNGGLGERDTLKFAEDDADSIADRLRYHDTKPRTENADHVLQILHTDRPVARPMLLEQIRQFFKDGKNLDLVFYFAGHGVVTDEGGCLVTPDGVPNQMGLDMSFLVNRANAAGAASVTILLDCCHAGAAGDTAALLSGSNPMALLRENIFILAASLPHQIAKEGATGGVFTAALRDGLDGAAADSLGQVTVSSLAAFVERRFSIFDQRPVAKAYSTRPVVLRKVAPVLTLEDQFRILDLFKDPGSKFALDPDHDPPRDTRGNIPPGLAIDEAKIAIGKEFKRYRNAGIVQATHPNEDFYYVAHNRHTLELTLAGREYWRYAKTKVPT